MEIQIINDGENIITTKNLEPEDRGEIAHFITELETLKQELLIIWEELKE